METKIITYYLTWHVAKELKTIIVVSNQWWLNVSGKPSPRFSTIGVINKAVSSLVLWTAHRHTCISIKFKHLKETYKIVLTTSAK